MMPMQSIWTSPRHVSPDFLSILTPLVNSLIKSMTTISSSKKLPPGELSEHVSMARVTTDKFKVLDQIQNITLLWELLVLSEKGLNKLSPPTHHHVVLLMLGFLTEIKMVPDSNGTQSQVLINTKLSTLIPVSTTPTHIFRQPTLLNRCRVPSCDQSQHVINI